MECDSASKKSGGASRPEQAVQLALATAPHRNQQVFSDHTL